MRSARRLAAKLACLLGLTLFSAGAGCGFQDGPLGPSDGDPPVNPTPLGPGRIFIGWTLGGRTPDPGLCGDLDHLSLKLAFAGGTRVKIEPIPCALDRFRYDGLPVGNADLTLTGVNLAGCLLTEATAAVAVSATQPTTPTPTVALPAPGPCR